VGEDRVGLRGPRWQVEPSSKRITAAADELNALSKGHSAVLLCPGRTEKWDLTPVSETRMAVLSLKVIATSARTNAGRAIEAGRGPNESRRSR
jgi:hypothetical protein